MTARSPVLIDPEGRALAWLAATLEADARAKDKRLREEDAAARKAAAKKRAAEKAEEERLALLKEKEREAAEALAKAEGRPYTPEEGVGGEAGEEKNSEGGEGKEGEGKNEEENTLVMADGSTSGGGSRGSSRPGSKEGSRPGSKKSSRPGSKEGSRPGSRDDGGGYRRRSNTALTPLVVQAGSFAPSGGGAMSTDGSGGGPPSVSPLPPGTDAPHPAAKLVERVAACAAEGRPVIIVLREWESFECGPLLPYV